MIRKSVQRFSEKIMRKQGAEGTNPLPVVQRSRCPLLRRGYVAGPSDTPAGPTASAKPP